MAKQDPAPLSALCSACKVRLARAAGGNKTRRREGRYLLPAVVVCLFGQEGIAQIGSMTDSILMTLYDLRSLHSWALDLQA